MAIQNRNAHFLNGKWVSPEEMVVSAFDLTVLRGYGVFDFIRSYDQKFVWLNEHLDRFHASAKTFDLEIPYSREELAMLFAEALQRNPDGDIYIRALLTGGISEDTLTKGRDNSLLLIVNYCKPVDPAIYEKGVSFATFSAPRQIPGVKSTNYTTSMYARYKLARTGIMDVLLVGEGDNPLIYEAAVNSIFFVRDGQVLTAPEDKVLGGIIRRKAIGALRQQNIPVTEQFIRMSDLPNLDECFATNSSLKVYPVVKIDGNSISNGCGPITKRTIEAIDRAIQHAR